MHKMQKIFLYILPYCETPLVATAKRPSTSGRKKERAYALSITFFMYS